MSQHNLLFQLDTHKRTLKIADLSKHADRETTQAAVDLIAHLLKDGIQLTGEIEAIEPLDI